jgi:hemolysin D
MEALNNYNMNGYKLTIWFFRLFLIIIIVAISLLFLLSINDTVSIDEGELIAVNPQCDYKAPFEAELKKINIKEGQEVRKGDTLLILQNKDVITQQAKTKAETEYLQKKIQSIIVLRKALQNKKIAITQGKLLSAKNHQLEVNKSINVIDALNEQYEYQLKRLSSAGEKYAADSILYQKDLLSKAEYNDTKDASFLLKENIANTKSSGQQQIAEKNLADNAFHKEQNDLSLRQVELIENEQSLIQTEYDAENQLNQAKEALKQIELLLTEQYIIATNTGVVNYIFNTTNTSNVMAKGDLLISVAPQNRSYYAKVIIPEKDIQYVKVGLNVQLKMDAYYYLEHGMIKGKVSYIAERKEKDKFFALIDLPELNNFQIKSGYKIQGEIILQQMPLYKYIIKKIFKNID